MRCTEAWFSSRGRYKATENLTRARTSYISKDASQRKRERELDRYNWIFAPSMEWIGRVNRFFFPPISIYVEYPRTADDQLLESLNVI